MVHADCVAGRPSTSHELTARQTLHCKLMRIGSKNFFWIKVGLNRLQSTDRRYRSCERVFRVVDESANKGLTWQFPGGWR
ncbi:hypothetical protein MPTK1_2g14980 [Marchantia polymorpha subsp. ruderalis]|uniref:Uncharacterized protein n=1 Tax=Marchantia polymorpha TaxID=3197 RepID=A0A2R6X1V7_MARPO|nr:hypothetical protein MARPO_0042s0121 [Marchantia polymorpha]BBN02392.1 hypothetical protein Mp_2g14980 [Marchantia polymorpha subsp. ruderalis]|eukprot:PTQ40088.1 hypothetical protein MARPO_0042s0121 [Marchantia polymorpha]